MNCTVAPAFVAYSAFECDNAWKEREEYSNGYIVVNGGTIAGGTPSGSDELLDSDCGNTVNGGSVITIGSSKEFGMRDRAFDREIPADWDKEPPTDWDKEYSFNRNPD